MESSKIITRICIQYYAIIQPQRPNRGYISDPGPGRMSDTVQINMVKGICKGAHIVKTGQFPIAKHLDIQFGIIRPTYPASGRLASRISGPQAIFGKPSYRIVTAQKKELV